jgi:hypothetical protein
VADAIRAGHHDPRTIAGALAPCAARPGLTRGDGLALLRWLLNLVGDPGTSRWTEEARQTRGRPLNRKSGPVGPRSGPSVLRFAQGQSGVH